MASIFSVLAVSKDSVVTRLVAEPTVIQRMRTAKYFDFSFILFATLIPSRP